MRLYTLSEGSKYRIIFDEKESKNLREFLGDNISIKNTNFCYYIENVVKKNFKELKKKYIMVLNVISTSEYVSVLIMAYTFNLNFSTPKDKRKLGRITEVSFKNISKFNKWMKNKKYIIYKVVKCDNGYKVIFLNLNTYDGINLALSDTNIIGNYNNIIEYLQHVID